MDLFRPRAIPALAALALATAFGTARADDCKSIHGTFSNESVEKVDGSPRTLSTFVSPKERPKLVRQEPATGPAPSFGGSGQVMSRPKVVQLVASVEVSHGPELRLKFLDAAGKPLLATSITTPTPWRCVSGRVERKFQMATGLGDVMRNDEVTQFFKATPDGDLTLVESRKVLEGPKAPPESRELHFKRLPKS